MSAIISSTVTPTQYPDDPVIPIQVRLRALYTEVRQMPGCYELADAAWKRMQFQLPGLKMAIDGGNLGGSITAAAQAATEHRAALLEQTEAALIELRDLDERYLAARTQALHMGAAPPPPTREDRAKVNLDSMQQTGGFRFELHQKSFRVTPASKLTAQQKEALTDLRAEITAELHRRADAWSPA